MRRFVLLLTVMALGDAGVASAQPANTLSGVAAFVEGDYQLAADILRPHAERWHVPADRAATFLLAMMYEEGLGVGADPVRACALLLRAANPSATSGGRPFLAPAMALVDDLESRLNPDQLEWCYFLSNIGFDHGFRPAAFSTMSGTWIEVELSAKKQRVIARLRFGGEQQQVDIDLPVINGTRFLATELTELITTRPDRAQRSFLEFFTWFPTRADEWSLMWSVVEVVRNTLVHVTSEEILTVTGDQAPPDRSIEPRDLAKLRVNDAGDAEWAVASQFEPRSDVIETDRERQELAAEKWARDGVDAKVDWSVRRTLDRVPSLIYPQASSGCQLAYGWSADRTEAITLRVEGNELEGSVSPLTFRIEQRPDIQVAAHVYDRPRRSWPFCTDHGGGDDVWETWAATAGLITIELAPAVRVREPKAYRATIHLSGAEFVSATGARVRQSQPITLSTVITLY